MGRLYFQCAARSAVGLVRNGNEDSALVGSQLIAVADGMGGHAGGEIASSVAINTLSEIAPTLINEDILHLRKAKANYSTRDDLEIRFDDGAYILVDQANRSNIKQDQLDNGRAAVLTALAAAKSIGQTITLSRNSPERFLLKFIEVKRTDRHDATDDAIMAAAKQMLSDGIIQEVTGMDSYGRPKKFLEVA